MSTWRAARIVWAKELRETLRDRKTVLVMVVMPLLLYPLLMAGMAAATQQRGEELSREPLRLGVTGGAMPAELARALARAPHTELVVVADARPAVEGGVVSAALLVPFDAALALSELDQVALVLVSDSTDDRSRELERRVKEALAGLDDEILRGRLERQGLRREVIEPLALREEDVAPPARRGGWLLAQFLPLMVSALMIGATFYPAIDFTAGEKERGTLQTLMTAPIAPIALVLGKYLAITVLALLTALSNLLALGLVAWSVPLPEAVVHELSFDLGLGVWGGVLACLVLLGMMFGALMMSVAVSAKGFKEAQHYLTPLYLVGLFPLALAAVPGTELDPLTAALPLYNLAVAMRQLMSGGIDPHLLVLAIASSLAWVALALVLATRTFSHEAVLYGDQGLKALFARRHARADRPPVPTLGEAVTLCGATLLLQLYLGPPLLSLPLLAALAVVQLGFLLGPSLALVRALRLDLRETLRLRAPPAWALAAGALCGLGSWVAAHLVMEPLAPHAPPPPPIFQALEEAVTASSADPLGVAGLFVVIAILPALCEEALFRGVLLGALRPRVRTSTAILVTALTFAAFHLNLQQFPVTFALGLLLGALVARSGSLWPAVACHALHNGGALAWGLWSNQTELGSSWALGLLLGPLAGALLWVARLRETPTR